MEKHPKGLTAAEVTHRIDRAKSYLLSVGDSAADIGVSILVLILVGRVYGRGGLGLYSFLLSVFVIVSFAADLGVGKYVERELAAGARGKGRMQDLLVKARGVVLLSALAGSLVTLAMGRWITGMDHVAGGAWPGFAILAAAVPFHLYAGFQSSVLHGRGDHATASRAGLGKRMALLISVYLLSKTRMRPDLLVLAFLFSEIIYMVLVRKALRLPPILASIRSLGTCGDTVRSSTRYYFTHEGLRVLFFIDFFLLGFFVSAAQEGSYAEASVLARLFLIIPLGAAPLFRVRVYASTGPERERIFADSRRIAARFFSIHSVVALAFLLYFPSILRVVFGIQGDVPVFFRIFSILLPGLLLFSSTVVLEPLFNLGEAHEKGLNRVALLVFLINAFLNVYLIPYAGVFGAAAATSLSLIVYFYLFARRMGKAERLPLTAYLLGCAAVYVAYNVLATVRMPALLVLLIIATVLPAVFGITGLYGENGEHRMLNVECRT